MLSLKQVLQFLEQLKHNNHRKWFEANKASYQTAKQSVKQLVEKLLIGIASFDTSLGSLAAKNCMFRINRDVRFSKDKSPYKINMGAYIAKGGKKSELCGYYLYLEPQNCFLGGGAYMLTPQNLYKIRQEIDHNASEF